MCVCVCVCVVLYLCLIDEEDDVGDCVDGHVDAQLNRPTVTDPSPDTQQHTHIKMVRGHTEVSGR